MVPMITLFLSTLGFLSFGPAAALSDDQDHHSRSSSRLIRGRPYVAVDGHLLPGTLTVDDGQHPSALATSDHDVSEGRRAVQTVLAEIGKNSKLPRESAYDTSSAETDSEPDVQSETGVSSLVADSRAEHTALHADMHSEEEESPEEAAPVKFTPPFYLTTAELSQALRELSGGTGSGDSSTAETGSTVPPPPKGRESKLTVEGVKLGEVTIDVVRYVPSAATASAARKYYLAVGGERGEHQTNDALLTD